MKAGGVPPSSIKVGALRYAVKPVRHLAVRPDDIVNMSGLDEHEHTPEGDVRLLGLCSTDEQVIYVESEVGPDMAQVVLLHEVIHACFAQAGMRDTLTFEVEESVVRRLSPLLIQTLQDNRRLVTYLTVAR